MKYEWRRSEKAIYLPKTKPELIVVPNAKYFTITGNGNPNNEEFSKKVEALYQASYGVRMMHKTNFIPKGYFEYTVYPLEGLWDLTDEGRNKVVLDKNDLVYKIMIKQPDFVDEKVFKLAINNQYQKSFNPLLKEIVFEEINDGLSVQMMHIGPYDDEIKTFKIMKEFIKENNLTIKSLVHREIYISDVRRTASEKLKTVLRYQVIKKVE